MKLKRCFSTLTCVDASVDEVLTYAKKHAMDGVEFRLDAAQTICGTSLDDADAIRAQFADAGVTITDLATGVNVTGLGDLDAEMKKAEGIACTYPMMKVSTLYRLRSRKADR